RQDQHVRREPDSRRLRGEEAEGGERVVVARAAHRRDERWNGDVLAAGEVMIAEAVGRGRDAGELGRAGELFPLGAVLGVVRDDRREEPETHGAWSLRAGRGRPDRRQLESRRTKSALER